MKRETVVRIIGGGLAGCEAAWQAASRGVPVTLYEMRPATPTRVHKTADLAELVCSNSFRGDKLDNAVGLLKEEMRRLGSLIMRAASASRVPAGAALAVDRERFSRAVTDAVAHHPLITIERRECTAIPEPRDGSPVILATGPLTSGTLSDAIRGFVGADHLYFYDAISPIVLAETIRGDTVFRASRWGRHSPDSPGRADSPVRRAGPSAPAQATDRGAIDAEDEPARACGVDAADGDYLNCPLTAEEYARFHDALIHAESATVHDFDKERFFEGCLPIEVMAHRGYDTLRFGPMKPVGLIDPRTGTPPYAVVQLRQDNLAGDHYSLVGFQTQLKWGEQARVLRLIPGLEEAEIVRFGMVHRNTYINAPTVLRETWQARARQDLFVAGQVSGVEGYVESAASGLIAGLNAARLAQGGEPLAPPRTTAIGALGYYVSHADPSCYQPTNITFGIVAPLDRRLRGRQAKRLAMAERALRDLASWTVGPASGAGAPSARAGAEGSPSGIPHHGPPHPSIA